jgi:hypothetical protein
LLDDGAESHAPEVAMMQAAPAAIPPLDLAESPSGGDVLTGRPLPISGALVDEPSEHETASDAVAALTEERIPSIPPVEPALEQPIAAAAPEQAHPEPIGHPIVDAVVPTEIARSERVSLELPADSGLVLVETRHASVQITDSGEPSAPRAKRVRPPRVELADEPLEMVETRAGEQPPAA